MLEKDLFLRGTILYIYIYIYIYIYMYTSLQDELGIGILDSDCQTSPATDWITELDAGNQSYPSLDRSVYFGGLWFRALPTEPRKISISQCIFIHCIFYLAILDVYYNISFDDIMAEIVWLLIVIELYQK